TSGPFELGILLHQLLLSEARELYRNLSFFAFSFALVDRSFAILGVADLLPRAESALAGGLFDGCLGDGELLAAAGEEFGDVLDRVVRAGWGRGLLPALRCRRSATLPDIALVFIFVRIVSRGMVVAARPRGRVDRSHTVRPHTNGASTPRS